MLKINVNGVCVCVCDKNLIVNFLLICFFIDGYGEVKYDIGYGGAFYALVDTRQLNMDVSHTPIHQLVRAADAISSAVKKSVQLEHPESADLAFLYGTILTDGKDEYSEQPTANLCIFADCEV
jgi:trans-L-3-hydroxyproline dehydratase